MELRYVGQHIAAAGIVPLPEGWPAQDHDEPRPGVAADKLASGAYVPAASDAVDDETESGPAEVIDDEEPPVAPRRRRK